MRVPVPAPARPLTAALRRGLFGTSLILLYHRVADLPSDPFFLSVTPRHFAEHLEVLRAVGTPVTLADLDRWRTDGRLPRRCIALTFDDGYADNLEHAKPLLERFDVPATVFVASGYLGSEHGFWWDELADVILGPERLPPHLGSIIREIRQTRAPGQTGEGNGTSDDLHFSAEAAVANDAAWRERVLSLLYQALLAESHADREAALKALRACTSESCRRGSHRVLSAADVVALSDGGLVDIGAHTVTHPCLSALAHGEQRAEIQKGKMQLEAVLGRPVTSFAYPHGAYSRETLSLVREARFERACSTVHDVVWRGSDRYQLPRFRVLDWDGETFARQLDAWLDS
jgi:peptidoglycan/xylan/chitin deacetylase (PgdA/CDA1 family)